MITSIFSKSKSINFIIVFFISLFAFLIARKAFVNEAITFQFIITQIGLFLVCYISILLLSFIASKNSLTNKNNYEVLLFSLFLLAITQTTVDANIILSNFFVLLGLRRIISLRSQTDVKKKLFDAAFWIAIATLLYFWAILFLILILFSLLFYTESKMINHWIIPFVGLATVFVITIAVSIVLNNSFFGIFKSLPQISYDFSSYNTGKYIVAITIMLSFGFWSSIFYIKGIKQKKKEFRTSFNIILVAVLLGFLIIIVGPIKDGSEFLFLFAPLSIIITNYIEQIEEKWFKEIFLSIIILVPFVLLFF